MRTFHSTLSAVAVALTLSSGIAQAQFSNIYFFGDSLTDAGSFKPALPPGTGLFTTNPGPVWSQLLAQRYGLTAIPANQGGTDYAEGGARVVGLPGVPDVSPTGTATPIAVQVSRLVGGKPLDPGALYSLWGGANDVFYQLGALGAGAITSSQLQANLAGAAGTLVQQVAILESAGARYIVVFNLPDIGKTPFGVGSGEGAQISAITRLYNSALMTGLDTLGAPVMRVNILALLNEVIANPAAFGISNVATPACGATPSLLCTSANLVTPGAASTYLFADGVHPTTAGHALIAQLVASMLEGPAKIGVLAEAPLAVEQASFRAIDGRMISGLDAPRARGKLDAWVAYDHDSNDFDGRFIAGSAKVDSADAGGDVRLSAHLLIGAAFGYSDNKGDFGAGGGGYTLKETTASAYAGYGEGPWYIGAIIGAGNLNYSDVRRNIQLGALTRTESGETRGWHLMGSVLGGYWFNRHEWSHGPFVKLTYQDIHVDAFSERGSDSTALSYGEQERKSLVTSLGWQVAGRIANVRPFARVAWDNESRNGDRFVSASPVALGGTYFVPAIKPDSSYMSYVLGASADFGHVTGYLTGSATSGRSDGNAYGVTVGLRVPL